MKVLDSKGSNIIRNYYFYPLKTEEDLSVNTINIYYSLSKFQLLQISIASNFNLLV